MSYPKTILQETIEKHLVEKLSVYGFEYFEKGISFKRKLNDFTNEIYFTGEKTNYFDSPNSKMNNIDFNCHFQIKSPRLKNWYKKNFLELDEVEFINPSLNLDTEKLKIRNSFDFVNEEHITIINTIYSNFINYYEPYFNKFNDWEALAEIEKSDSKIDYLIMFGKIEEAQELCKNRLNEVNSYFNTEDYKTNCKAIPSFSTIFDDVLLNLKLKREYIERNK